MTQEQGSIERDIHIEASPEVVFEVVTSPAHIKEWWGGVQTDLRPVPGAEGELRWGTEHREVFKVVDADPPRLFSFRWVYPDARIADDARSLLVTFALTPTATGTQVRVTETGFREMGWEVAVLEQAYQEHVEGWDLFVPQLGAYAEKLAASR